MYIDNKPIATHSNSIIFWLGLVLSVIFFFGSIGSAEAVTNNSRNVSPDFADLYSNFTRCGPDSNPQRHAQYTWLSPASNTEIDGAASAVPGSNSIDLKFNSAAAHCDRNINPDGTINLQDIRATGTYFTNDDAPILQAQIISPTGTGASVAVSGITASSPNVLDYSCSHTHSLRYVKRCSGSDPNQPVISNNLRLSGLNSFPASVDTIRVRVFVNVRQVNQFDNGRYYCVLGRTSTGGLIQTNAFGLSPVCDNKVEDIDVIITRIPPDLGSYNISPDVTCSVRNGQINYRIDKTGDLAANNVNVTLQYTRNGTVTPVFSGQVDIPDTGFDRQTNVSGLSVGDSLSARIVVDPSSSSGGGPLAKDEDCGELTARPYFRVYGGDVIAGRQQHYDSGRNPSSCEKNNSANIKAYSRDLASGIWVGSGGQFAVSAAGSIEGFFSANLRNGASNPSPRSGLLFANSEADGSTLDVFGDDQTAYTGCTLNIYDSLEFNNDLEKLGNTADLQSGTSPYRIYNSSTSQEEMIFSSGTMNITRNVEYRESSTNSNPVWDNLESVKVPIIVVDGDINIAPNVTRLDGLYFATGDVNTCSGDISQCNRKLTINGALIARKVQFRRTLGDVNSLNLTSNRYQLPDASSIAEVINFSPEIYLVLSQISGGGDLSNNTNYDSIVGLPPVL